MAPVEKTNVLKKNDAPKDVKVTKRPVKYTSRGREVVVPKKILRTSSDEAPRRKSKTHTSVHKGLETLRSLVVKNPELQSLLKLNASILNTSSKQHTEKKEKNIDDVSRSASAKDVPCSKISPIQLSTSSASKELSAAEQTATMPNNAHNESRNSSRLVPITSHMEKTINPLINDQPEKSSSNLNRKFYCAITGKQYAESENTIIENNEDMEYDHSQLEEEHGTDQLENTNLGNSTANASKSKVNVDLNILQNILQHFEKVKNEYTDIEGLLKEIQRDIKSIKNETDIAHVKPLFTTCEEFPLQTMAEFDVFERDPNKQRKLYAELMRYGGSKLREALSVAFKASMSDKLATEFTWYGERQTKNFAKSRLASLLNRVVRKCQNFPGPQSETEFKIEMMEVLRAAKQRHRNTVVKKLHKNNCANDLPSEDETDPSDQEAGEFESENVSSDSD